ncbi:BMC domain-containing protein [Oleidesulfovibrio alaskensis]|jgi:microcompartment protein CcmL/EutN|uniref:BMC domain-containing protein n=1 Tax=Oleidesulfovibrio alaskensis TaxID=58180 RepID=UPI001A3AEA66|nr:BMC domain-containing protein [Oleidesulfovibrio alaskensis]MBL3581125.1 BMC domain-containing protein [Oleidesulfovibrio alaskensis]
MDLRTIGCVELNSVAMGMHTADEMVKAAEVELVVARPTCPGRYIAIVAGDTGAVKSSVETGCRIGGEMLVDFFVLASVHPDVIPALGGAPEDASINALGVIETCTSASCILAADAAAKAAQVHLLEIRFAAGLAGKAFVVMTGDVSSVQAAVEAGVAGVGESGPVLSHVVIPSPSEGLKARIL